MKKLYNEFFHVPKHGKIREKVMLTRVIMAVTVIFMCLGAMGITAYAYFSHSITSGSNVIKAASFEADVLISITENGSSEPVSVAQIDNLTYTAKLEAGKTYTVTLGEGENSTAKTGFCVITATNCKDTYHTQQLGADTNVEGGFTDKITFQLKATDDTTVTFLSHWGTSSHYEKYVAKGENDRLYITNADINDGRVVMIVNDVSEAECDANKETENTPQESEEEKIDEAPVTSDTQIESSDESSAAQSGTSAEPSAALDTENTLTESFYGKANSDVI